LLSALILVCLTVPVARAGNLSKAIELIMQKNRKAAKAQKRIDKLSDQKADLLGQFRAVQQQIESVKAYNAQVSTLLAAQQTEIDSLNRQIDDATNISREVMPLMLRMLDALENFIELDVPFMLDERTKSVADLRAMMDRADVADSEKFRRILEAYEIETDFARNINAYKGDLSKDGKERIVNFLRVGRVALVYLTQDGKEAGVWNQKTRQWEVLPDEYRSSIKEGLRIAQKKAAPDLIRLPVPPAEVAK
jgi:hypothetical protein